MSFLSELEGAVFLTGGGLNQVGKWSDRLQGRCAPGIEAGHVRVGCRAGFREYVPRIGRACTLCMHIDSAPEDLGC